MAVNDVYQVTLESRMHGQAILNTFHYKEAIPEVTNPIPEQELSNSFIAVVASPWLALLSNECSHISVLCQKIHPVPPFVPYLNVTGAGAGGIAVSALPTSVALVITKRTLLAGRKYRGRTFVAGMPVTQEDDSGVAAAAILLWNVVATAMTATLLGNEGAWAPVIFHKSDGTTNFITTCLTRPILRNQRRRQLGKGI